MPAAHGHHAVGRIDRVLEVVARATVAPTMTEVAAATGLPRSTTSDLLRELRRHGYLDVVDRRYRLGRRLDVLALLGGLGPTAPLSHERLEEISRASGAPVVLAIMVGGHVLYVDSAGPPAPHHLQVLADQHRPRPAVRTAAGRLLLSCGDVTDHDDVLHAIAPTDREGVAAFERERARIRRARLARSDGLADPGTRAVAVPITAEGTLGHRLDEGVVAALVVLGSRPRGPASDTVSPALDRAVARVQEALTYQA